MQVALKAKITRSGELFEAVKAYVTTDMIIIDGLTVLGIVLLIAWKLSVHY